MAKCSCGSGKEYSQCCEPYISGKVLPPTPEALMRSRYTAYSQANIDYIKKTMLGKALQGFDESGAREWAKKVNWLGLQVIRSVDKSSKDNVGLVEFLAKYTYQGEKHLIYEVSEFVKKEGVWYYVDGVNPKIGRNDTCSCGSGKKYKKCCLL
jgi:SEC-C motif domain protein